jgi:phage tail-like protein
MASTDAAIDYPLVAYNYRVVVGSITMRFAKVDGLVWERKAITYRDGLSFLDGESIALCRVDAYTTLTLQQGVMESDSALHSWLETGDARLLEVQLCKPKTPTDPSTIGKAKLENKPVLAWKANRAIPVKLTASALDSSSNDVVIDTLELRAAGWSIKRPI